MITSHIYTFNYTNSQTDDDGDDDDDDDNDDYDDDNAVAAGKDKTKHYKFSSLIPLPRTKSSPI